MRLLVVVRCTWMLPEGIDFFAGDLSEEEKQIVWATATPPATELFNQKPNGTAWKTKPSAYIVANNDRAVHPDLERSSAERMGTTTYTADRSHVPMLSHPALRVWPRPLRDACVSTDVGAPAVAGG